METWIMRPFSPLFFAVTAFFLLLPPLQSCALSAGPKRLDRRDALLMGVLTLAYAVCARI